MFVGHNATVNGRVVVGDDVWIGPGAVISNELTIGTRAHIALGSTVMQAVPENGRVAGTPALEQHIMFRHAGDAPIQATLSSTVADLITRRFRKPSAPKGVAQATKR